MSTQKYQVWWDSLVQCPDIRINNYTTSHMGLYSDLGKTFTKFFDKQQLFRHYQQKRLITKKGVLVHIVGSWFNDIF